MNRTIHAFLLGLALWVPALVPAADPPRADDKEIRKLVTDLESSSFQVRQKATEELTKLGNKAIPALEEVLRSNPSLEMRQRVEQILAKVSVPPEELFDKLLKKMTREERLIIQTSNPVPGLIGDKLPPASIEKLSPDVRSLLLQQQPIILTPGMMEKLALDDKQKEKFVRMKKEMDARIESALKQKRKPGDHFESVSETKRSAEDRLMSLLTPEQKQKYLNMRGMKASEMRRRLAQRDYMAFGE